ncbi:ABC transporter ATP-binding protein [Myxosarcina sp. GI1]|uniref:ABC transporter ATP-binding protein n=1 Tax=Myxosarcina sp. GI1 TaxID=1541065 RepID=UPI0005694E40|nr:ABC transporter ATP-binding protein [Myxosarcina sp. GI1]
MKSGSNDVITKSVSLQQSGSLQPKLEVRNLSKTFHSNGINRQTHKPQKQILALDNITFDIYPREFVCIVGASGCGKSTLLNIIAGLLPPSTGKVSLDGTELLGPSADRGMVFQNYTLFPWLTVADNIGFGLKLKKISPTQRKQIIGYYLEIIGLTQFANAYPKQLSGGMKQRVAIARALANEPEILLLDEPFGALDAQTKEQMQEFLLDLWNKTHTTILMITHDVEEAIFLAQRICVMSAHPGRLKETIEIDLPARRDLEIKLTRKFIEQKRLLLQALR